MSKVLVRRILKRVNVNPLGCWEWTGSMHRAGYGKLNVGGKVAYAHRIIYEATNGHLPAGLFVCHRCDNPKCCNPDHLFAGTPEQNTVDSVQKDRHARGERNGHAMLTAEQVLAIRSDTRAHAAIAAEYGISAPHVCGIQRGKFWKHLPGGRQSKPPKLTDEQVQAIKQRHTGRYGCGAALAREFGVSQSYISWIAKHG